MTDYHTKPVLAVRVPGELQDWARGEAKRRGQRIGDYVTGLMAAERDGISPERYGDLCALFEAAWHHSVPESLDDLPPMTSKEARRLALLAAEAMNRD